MTEEEKLLKRIARANKRGQERNDRKSNSW